MIFANPMVTKLQKLLKEADEIEKVEELRNCSNKMNDILVSVEASQVSNFIDDQLGQSEIRRMNHAEAVREDFNRIELEMRQEFKSPIANEWLNASKKQDNQKGFPHFKRHMLIAAWGELKLAQEIESLPEDSLFRPLLYLCPLNENAALNVRKEEIKKIIERLFYTSNVMLWDRENSKYEDLLRIKNGIRYIRKFRGGLGDQCNKTKLKLTIQDVCGYFLHAVATEKALRSLPIDAIQYDYTPNKDDKKVTLILYVNGKYSIKTFGKSARKAYELLRNPYDCKEFEKLDNKQNVVLQKYFDGLNKQIAKKWGSYGFRYGIENLFHSDGYYHEINQDYASLISLYKKTKN